MALAMRDCFDFSFYWELLDGLTATHRALRFADVADGFPEDMFFILRHDVDYSTAAALALARQESQRGVRATYFLLPNSLYYNLLDPAHAELPRQLAALGHDIGLHYDVRLLYRFPPSEWPHLVEIQISLLEALSGTRVRAVAMHQPGLNGADPLRHHPQYLNAYDDRFFRDMPYISDSCRAWRDAAWSTLASGTLPRRFQLALHPINWSTADRDRAELFQSIHTDLVRSIETAGQVLLEQIQDHPAVIEHEARAERPLAGGNGSRR
jgi:hypothetical protein